MAFARAARRAAYSAWEICAWAEGALAARPASRTPARSQRERRNGPENESTADLGVGVDVTRTARCGLPEFGAPNAGGARADRPVGKRRAGHPKPWVKPARMYRERRRDLDPVSEPENDVVIGE